MTDIKNIVTPRPARGGWGAIKIFNIKTTRYYREGWGSCREREGVAERDRERDRQRQRDREREKRRERKKDRERYIEIEKDRSRYREKENLIHIEKHVFSATIFHLSCYCPSICPSEQKCATTAIFQVNEFKPIRFQVNREISY